MFDGNSGSDKGEPNGVESCAVLHSAHIYI